ncbi:MAG: SlyX family protein [Burkholderiaceae bacterium]
MGELPNYPDDLRGADARQSHDTERRLTELEIKAAYAEDLLEALNTQVARQHELIETLLREIRRLREQQAGSRGETPSGARDELPPHY